MQLSAKKSSFQPKRQKMSNFHLFAETMNRYAQTTGPTTPDSPSVDPAVEPEGQQLDPNSLQVGQQVYDVDGTALTVIQNENGNVTTVPQDQAGQQVPQGVKTVQPQELNDYSLQPPQQNVQAKIAQEEDFEGIDWEELQSIALEAATFAQGAKEKAFFDALDRLNTAALSYVQMPNDLNPARDMIASTKVKSDSRFVRKISQEVTDRLSSVKEVTLEALASILDDIGYEAFSQPGGYFEAATKALIDGVADRLVIEIVPPLENLAEEAFAEFLGHFSAYIDAEEMPENPNEQQLMKYYESYL